MRSCGAAKVDALEGTGATLNAPQQDQPKVKRFCSGPRAHRNPTFTLVFLDQQCDPETQMNSIIYIVGLVVIVVAILGFFGLR